MNSESYGTGDYHNDTKEDLAQLQAERAELDPGETERIERLNGYIAQAEGILAKLREELNPVHEIAGDPSSQAERMSVDEYNRQVDRARGQKMYMDTKTGLVSSDSNNL